ncbi:uncharacterized protein LOC114525918 isoform X2 [Dendronephthya gigantea]|uniref:uncharacterized protein LOC114525918 isoform X2 n=1 Tax=Dendronephthya gigantea TaxID=151771 RepID=UPI0010697930|nr:uncharacterized protein LOC114525918 isoform X2 [Dendronephthya gigantea]
MAQGAKVAGIPWEEKESQNFIRAEYVTRAVRKELRNFFIQEWNTRYEPSHGAWDDTNKSGQELFNREKTRSRPHKKKIQSKFKQGNTNEWDCSILFDAICFSDSIGASLKPEMKAEINNLRKLRNRFIHDFPDKKLSDKDFENITTGFENSLKVLGLSTSEIVRLKDIYNSFRVLPPKPTHEVVSRSDKIHEIREVLEKLRSDNDGKLTYFYISGNPGSGKSELARQVCEDISNAVSWQRESMFIMKLDGRDLNSLLHSYEKLCHYLHCEDSKLRDILESSKQEERKIRDLTFQVTQRIENWKKWWIIVDNVENLELISKLLPQMGDDVWSKGQIILTTQNTNSVPSNRFLTKHISLSLGMDEQECRQLLAFVSGTDVKDPILDEVAVMLDRQPLAMASAAFYMKEVIDIYPDFSWKCCLEKFEKGERESTEETLKGRNSAAYPFTMTTAVLLAVTKCSEKDKILQHAFSLFSWISFEPLPLDLIVKYIQKQDKQLDMIKIALAIKDCSLFLSLGQKHLDIRLHRVVHEAIKIVHQTSTSYVETEENNWKTAIHNVIKTMYHFKDREDKSKLIPHLKAFNTEINKQFPKRWLCTKSSNFNTTEISEMYLFFGDTLDHFSEFQLSIEFQQSLKFQLERYGPNHTDVTLS